MPLKFLTSRKYSLITALKGALLALLLSSFLFSSAGARDLTYQYRESLVRAAFLYSLTKFVAWPADTFSRPNAPLLLSVLDPGMDDEALASIDGRLVHGRPLQVRPITDSRQIGECHILYIGASSGANVGVILDRLSGRPVLSVSDIDGFVEESGMVELFQEGKKMRFGVNLDAARRADLVLSSEVLRLASFVRGKQRGRE